MNFPLCGGWGWDRIGTPDPYVVQGSAVFSNIFQQGLKLKCLFYLFFFFKLAFLRAELIRQI